jgi:cobalt/nickel transport system permease protein
VHRLPAARKLAVALALLVLVSLSYRRGSVVAGVLLPPLVGVALLARLPLRVLFARVAFAESFVLGVLVLTLFQDDGLAKFGMLALRSTVAILIVQVLVQTTPFDELLHVFRAWHMPAFLVTTMALLYRYSFVLREESARMQRARRARSMHPPDGRWRARAELLGQLFVRSTDRAERIGAAMRSRGGQ